MKLDDLKPAPYNPREIDDEAFAALGQSIDVFGDIAGITWNKQTGHLVAGHQRVDRLKQMGAKFKGRPPRFEYDGKTFPVRVVDWPLEKEKAANVAANNYMLSGKFDSSVVHIAQEIRDAFGDDFFTGLRFDALVDQFNAAPDRAVQDEVPDLPKKAVTKPGDIWMLGRHSAVCGDSTDPGVLGRMKSKASLCVTSPPYWVGKDYETQKSRQDIEGFMQAVASVIVQAVGPDLGRIVINTANGLRRSVEKRAPAETWLLLSWWIDAFRPHKWLMRHCRVWAKSGGLPASIAPRSDVVDQHWEYIATLYQPGAKNRGMIKAGDPKWAYAGVWDFAGAMTVEGEAATHKAAFPVELPWRNMLLYSLKDELVFEPFLGAGTTIIAAEQLDRVCYGIEMDPRYVDVTVERWQNLTGKKAKRKRS